MEKVLYRILVCSVTLFIYGTGVFAGQVSENTSSVSDMDEREYQIIVPVDMTSCGQFMDDSTLEQEYQFKTMVHYAPGVVTIPQGASSVEGSLLETVEFGPDRIVAEPLGEGVFTRKDYVGGYYYSYDQQFTIGAATFTYSIYMINFQTSGPVITFDEAYLQISGIYANYQEPDQEPQYIQLGSCYHATLPLWQIEVELEGDRKVTLHQRFQPPMVGSGPAMLTMGHAELPEATATTTSYWELVYAADHHNWNERFWMLFDPPIDEQYGVGVFEHLFGEDSRRLHSPTYSAMLLDRNLRPLQPLRVQSYKKVQITETPTPTHAPVLTPTAPPTDTPVLPTATNTPTNTSDTPTPEAPNMTATVTILMGRPGDANRDLFVNSEDFRCVRDYFGQARWDIGDANADGFVNSEDFRAVRDNFGQSYLP